MDAYAVIETGGEQYRGIQGSPVDDEGLEGDAGNAVKIGRLLAVSDASARKIGTPEISGASVTAEIVKQFRGDKVIAFRKKKRKGFHKKQGHRQDLTQIKIA